jgi:hypothetical protein
MLIKKRKWLQDKKENTKLKLKIFNLHTKIMRSSTCSKKEELLSLLANGRKSPNLMSN